VTGPDLSIVIVNWNTRELLLRLLAQLLPPGGESPSCEVLVVDNASDDGSVAAARAAFAQAIVLPRPQNGGFAYAVNHGIASSRGRWIMLLNTDTSVRWDDLRRLVAAAEQRPEGAVFGPRILDEHGVPQRSCWTAPRPIDYLRAAIGLGDRTPDRGPLPGACTPVDNVSGCVFMVRRSDLRSIGGLDERFFLYFEETDLCTRVRAAGRRVFFVPEASFVHVGGLSAELAARRTFLAFRESCLLYHVAWHGRLRTEGIRASLLVGCVLRLLYWLLRLPFGGRNRAGLYCAAIAMLSRPGLVGELAARPRRTPAVS